MDIDFDKLYERLGSLDVEISFSEELGFPYLKSKMAEVIRRNGEATTLLIYATRQKDLLAQDEMAQKTLYRATGSPAHKEAAEKLRSQLERIDLFLAALKIRKQYLSHLPGDLRVYVRLLENDLELSRRPEGQLLPENIEKFRDPRMTKPVAVDDESVEHLFQ